MLWIILDFIFTFWPRAPQSRSLKHSPLKNSWPQISQSCLIKTQRFALKPGEIQLGMSKTTMFIFREAWLWTSRSWIFFSICLFFVRNQSRHMLFVTTYSNVQSSLVVWCAKVTRRRSELSEQLSPRSLASWAPPDSYCTMGPNLLWNSLLF